MNNELLQNQLKHAHQTVPYYNSLFNNMGLIRGGKICFSDIPLLEKNKIMETPAMFISNKYLSKYKTGDLLCKRTSGSTGRCMSVYWLPNDYYISNIEAWKYRYKWFNISVKDKYVSFHSTLYVNGNIINSPDSIIMNKKNVSFNKTMLNNENIHIYIKKIQEFQPTWMLVQPSVLHALLSESDSSEREILNHLQYIELISEYEHKSTRRFFQESLPKVKFSNMYGTTETGCVALECPFGKQHILNNAIVEVFDDNYSSPTAQEGNIVLTSLRNTAMPLIRYCIGDRGRVFTSKCKCGFEGHDISITLGRESDIIELPNGEKRHSSVFWQIVEEVLYEYPDSITQFHVIQDGPDSLRIHLALKEKYKNWTNAIETSFKNTVGRYLGHYMSCQFEYQIGNPLRNGNKLNVFSRI